MSAAKTSAEKVDYAERLFAAEAELRNCARAFTACESDLTVENLRDAAQAFAAVVNSINLGLNARGGS